jgi:ABC-type branched-subunit amino acid transport system ATPase component
VTKPLLAVRGLTKRFGGVVATDRVDLDVHTGHVHALIGPNGAGKTTLVAMIAGQLKSDTGRVAFEGVDITRLPAHRRARCGLVRSFQITRLFKSFTVREQLALAAMAVDGGNLNPWRRAANARAAQTRAEELLVDLSLADKAGVGVDALSHGERRVLEVGLALASRPRLVLLDEPMAGLGPEESQRMEGLIGRLRQKASVLLIEHDVLAVFRLADRVSVLVNGAIVASDTPEVVRRDARVNDAYLGGAA